MKVDMDFKYIEQLLERYFAAETTLQEEQILREFFAQDEVPEQLQPWKALFTTEKSLAETHLDDHFDQRLLQLTGEEHVQARRITVGLRLYPLFKAAAIVAFAIVLGTAVEHASQYEEAPDTGLQANIAGEDELDADETTVIEVRSANAEPVDSTDAMLRIDR